MRHNRLTEFTLYEIFYSLINTMVSKPGHYPFLNYAAFSALILLSTLNNAIWIPYRMTMFDAAPH